MEHHETNEGQVQLRETEGQELKKTITTYKPRWGSVSIMRDVSEGIHPLFTGQYTRQLFFPADAQLRILEDVDSFFYVSTEEAKRIANHESDVKCPLCEAGIPVKPRR